MGFCERKGVKCDIIGTTLLGQCKITGCFKSLPDVKEERYLGDGYCDKRGGYCEKIYDTINSYCDKCTGELPAILDDETITGIFDTATSGKEFAIGTKNQATGFVLNFSNKSCLLFTGDAMPIDLRQFNFDEFTSIEINGNKFVKEIQQ